MPLHRLQLEREYIFVDQWITHSYKLPFKLAVLIIVMSDLFKQRGNFLFHFFIVEVYILLSEVFLKDIVAGV